MKNSYTERLDKEIESWIEKRDGLKADPNFFKNEIEGIKMFKTQVRQEFTMDYIQGRISGLIEAKALCYGRVLQRMV